MRIPSSHELTATQPSILRVAKSSYKIIKSDSHITSAASSTSSSTAAAAAAASSKRPKPVIIYTQAPRIIHTTPDLFKSLIQKLTGCLETTPLQTEVTLNQNDHALEISPMPPAPPAPPPPPMQLNTSYLGDNHHGQSAMPAINIDYENYGGILPSAPMKASSYGKALAGVEYYEDYSKILSFSMKSDSFDKNLENYGRIFPPSAIKASPFDKSLVEAEYENYGRIMPSTLMKASRIFSEPLDLNSAAMLYGFNVHDLQTINSYNFYHA